MLCFKRYPGQQVDIHPAGVQITFAGVSEDNFGKLFLWYSSNGEIQKPLAEDGVTPVGGGVMMRFKEDRDCPLGTVRVAFEGPLNQRIDRTEIFRKTRRRRT